MNCPHCGKSISLLSKELNSFKKIKNCPFCSGEMKGAVRWGRFFLIYLLVVIPLVIIGFTPWGYGIAGGAAALLGMELKPVS
jgi:hypothetical protein